MVPPPSPPASGQTPSTSPPKVETAPSPPTAPPAQELSGPSIPAPPSPPELTTPVPSPPIYFVNVHGLALRDGPTMYRPQSPPATSTTRWNSWAPRADGGGFGRCGAILSAGPL